MTIRDMKGKIENKIPVNNVIISCFDKKGLESFIPSLIEVTDFNIMFMSTGGTYKKIKELLGNDAEKYLMEVAEYTEFPEMEGGLVKTLHPKIHAGILGERNNPEHQKYLKETLNNGVYIDMVVVNLYPFTEVISNPDATFEKARGNIDIGGPTMLRAAAKNFPSCAVVSSPCDYDSVLQVIDKNNGCTTFEQRLNLAAKVFKATAAYDSAIESYFNKNIMENGNKIKESYFK